MKTKTTYLTYSSTSLSSVYPTFNDTWSRAWFPKQFTNSRQDGVAVYNWRQKVRNFVSASSGLAGTRWNLEVIQGNLDATWKSFPYIARVNTVKLYGRVMAMPSWSHTQGSTSEAENRALKSIYARLQQEQAHWRGLVAAGELSETLGMVRKAAKLLATDTSGYLRKAKSLVNSYLGYQLYEPLSRYPSRSGRAYFAAKPPSKRKIKTLNKRLADLWLTYAFEIRPTVNDISSACETIARWKTEWSDDHYATLRGYGRSEQLISSSTTIAYENSFELLEFRRRISKVEVIYRVGYRGQGLVPGGTQSALRLAELSGFGWREFLPSMWNLLPWSFMVDTFVNVSELLSAACTAVDGIQWIHKTIRWETEETASDRLVRYSGGPPTFTAYGSPSSYRMTSSSFSRGAVAGLNFPSVQFRIPGSDSTAWINILALLQK